METIFNSPDKYQSKFAVVDNYRTHYLEAGSQNEDRVLLVHGGANYIGMDCTRWYPTIIPLARDFHVYAIDELGSGETDPPRDPNDLMHVRVRAEHVIHFIETLGLAPVNLVGQSQGGWIVTYITLKRPDLIKKLVLIDSGSTSGSAIKTDAKAPDKMIEVDGQQVKVDGSGRLPYFEGVFVPGTMMPKDKALTNTKEGFLKWVGSSFHNKSVIPEEFLDHLLELSKKWNDLYWKHKGPEYWKGRNIADYKKMYYVDGVHIRELVKNIAIPTLVIWGKNSKKGIDPGVELYKRIPNAQMHIFDKANHFVWCDQWKDFNSLVEWFLTKE